MLEAKDQGCKRKCSPKKKKKKGLHKNFLGDLKKKKKGLHKNFSSDLHKNVFQKIFQALHKILTIQKIVLSSSSRTALFFGKLKFCGAVEKFFGKRFFVEIA